MIDADGVTALLRIGYFDASGYTFMTLYNYGGKGYQITSTGLTQEEGDVVAQILDTLHVTNAPAAPTPTPAPTPAHIPASVTDIADDAFSGSEGALICTSANGSAAMDYAIENGMEYVILID